MTGILLVDDDRLITDPLARALREAGYTVWTAATGPAGLEMAETQQPDAIILDIMLPGMDGWQVCQALRRRSAVPILMLTALGDVPATWADVDDLVRDVGYKPDTPVEEGIARFVQWYKEYYGVAS